MWQGIRRFFAPPVFPEDEILTMRASMLNGLLISLFVVFLFFTVIGIPFFFEEKTVTTLSALAILASTVISWWLVRRGRLRAAGLGMVIFAFIGTTLIIGISGGLHSLDLMFFLCGVVFAGLVFGSRGTAYYALACLGAGLSFLLLENAGVQLPHIFSFRPAANWMLLAANLAVVAFTLNSTLGHLQSALDRMRAELAERKRMEASLQASESRYRDLVEKSTDGIWLLSFDRPIPTSLSAEEQVRLIQASGVVTEANDAIARMYGYPDREAFIGIRLMTLYGDSPSEINFQSTLKLVRDGYRSDNRETVEYDRTGRRRYFINNAVGIIRDGVLLAMWGTQRDITAEKEAGLALQTSEARMRALLEAVPDLIFEIDRHGRIVEFVPAKESATYAPPASFMGRPLGEVLPAEVSGIAVNAIVQALETGQLQKIEYQLPMPGGMSSYEARITPASPERVLVIIRDITERRHAEQEREKLIGELEAKNSELERFTYTVSHDLKSPLITIRGFAGYIEKDLQAGNPQRAREDIQRVFSATDKMQGLLNDLLELSRVGRLIKPVENLPFEDAAREALELVRGAVEARGVRVEIAPGLPAVMADRARLVQALQNLMDNAVKFMGDQPAPAIWIGSSGRDGEGRPIFFVRDNGIGIAPEFHQRIFGLFNKLDPATEGSGIGLALVKRIIEVHGGLVWVDSRGDGKGAAFYFSLPAATSG